MHKFLYISALLLLTNLARAGDAPETAPNAKKQKACTNLVAVAEKMSDTYSVIADRLGINRVNLKVDIQLDADGKVVGVEAPGVLPEFRSLLSNSLPSLECIGTGQPRTVRYPVEFVIPDEPSFIDSLKALFGQASPEPAQDTLTTMVVVDAADAVFVNQQRATTGSELETLLAGQPPQSYAVVWGDNSLNVSALANVLTTLHRTGFDFAVLDDGRHPIFVMLDSVSAEQVISDFGRVKRTRVDIGTNGKVLIDGKTGKLDQLKRLPKHTGRLITLRCDSAMNYGKALAAVRQFAWNRNTWVLMQDDEL